MNLDNPNSHGIKEPMGALEHELTSYYCVHKGINRELAKHHARRFVQIHNPKYIRRLLREAREQRHRSVIVI
jgi:hypothetical protein